MSREQQPFLPMNPLVGAIKVQSVIVYWCLRIRSWDTSENIWLELYQSSSIHFNGRYVTFCSFDNDQGACYQWHLFLLYYSISPWSGRLIKNSVSQMYFGVKVLMLDPSQIVTVLHRFPTSRGRHFMIKQKFARYKFLIISKLFG